MNAITKWVPSARAQVIRRRTYARPLETGGFEEHHQVVDRVIQHQRWLWERALGDMPLSETQHYELEELRCLMLEYKASVSGRTLWLGGTELSRRREASQFNCSFLRTETVHDLVDAFWLLLQGCGVGFEPVVGNLSGFTKTAEIEVIRSQRHKLVAHKGRENTIETLVNRIWTITIGDSAEAWAKSIGKIVAQKKSFDKIVLDFSQIRPAGYRLKGYGWISSGDETFSTALVAICKIMNTRAGQLLNRIDIIDVMNWLGTTLSSRRSAEIAIMPYGDPEWETFARMKLNHWEHNPQRSMSNNSLLFYKHPGRDGLVKIFDLMKEAGGSEPGFINAEQALVRAPWFKGPNPCLTGDTLIPTDIGLVRIADAAGQTVGLRDGNGNIVFSQIKQTAESAELLQVELSDGSLYRVTPHHEFVLSDGRKIQAHKMLSGLALKPADISGMFGRLHAPTKAYISAWLIADGTWHNDHGSSKLSLYQPKYIHQAELEDAGFSFTGTATPGRVTAFLAGYPLPDKSRIPGFVLGGDAETVKAFIRGYMQSDGHISHSDKGCQAQIVSVHRGFLQDFQALLNLFGIKSKVAKCRDAGLRDLPDGKGGTRPYECQASFRLSITGATRLAALLGIYEAKKALYTTKASVTVVEVTKLVEREAVYCAGVPTTASFDLPTVHSGNCAEILLPNKGFCNLVEVNLARFNDDPVNLYRAMQLMARANYRQTCVDLNDGILQRAWHENNEFLRLCGVGVTGIVGWNQQDNYAAWEALNGVAVTAAYSMADELGLPRPKNVTTVKPSGTLSKVMDTTEGAHKPLGRFIFNNVRFSINDPYVEILREAGYRIFVDPYNKDGILVTFPVENLDVEFEEVNGRFVNTESAVAQLDRYKLLMDHYVDQNCSITVSYDLDEVPAIIDWLDENWDKVVGMSFLYRTDPTKTAADLGYPYLPQEVVEENVFRDYVATLRPIDRGADASSTPVADDVELEVDAGSECAGGVCPVR